MGKSRNIDLFVNGLLYLIRIEQIIFHTGVECVLQQVHITLISGGIVYLDSFEEVLIIQPDAD